MVLENRVLNTDGIETSQIFQTAVSCKIKVEHSYQSYQVTFILNGGGVGSVLSTVEELYGLDFLNYMLLQELKSRHKFQQGSEESEKNN